MEKIEGRRKTKSKTLKILTQQRLQLLPKKSKLNASQAGHSSETMKRKSHKLLTIRLNQTKYMYRLLLNFFFTFFHYKMNNHSKKKDIDQLKIFYLNSFKMSQLRLVELKLFLDKFKPDILAIQEIKLNQEQANLYLRFDEYLVHYTPRISMAEFLGGVAILVRKKACAHIYKQTRQRN